MRRRRRRRVEALLALLLVFLLALGGDRLLHSPMLAVRRIVVEGGPPFLADLAGVRPGTPLVDVPTAEVAARLRRLDPWVQDASVVRSFPSTLVLSVRMRRVVALVETGHGVLGVDSGRTLLPVSAAAMAAYPLLGGVEAPDRPFWQIPATPKLEAELSLLAALPPGIRRQVSEVDAGPSGLSLILLSGVRVDLGQPLFLDTKFRVLAAILRTLAERHEQAAVIHLEDPEAPTLVGAP